MNLVFTRLPPSVLFYLSQPRLVSISFWLQPLSSPMSPSDGFIFLCLPLHSSYSSFHLSSPVNSHLPTPCPWFCTYAFVSSLPHLLTFHLHSFSPGSSCHPNCPFWLLFSTNSSLVSCLFSFLVFFYVTWHRLTKTPWQVPHSTPFFVFFFASPLFFFCAGPTNKTVFSQKISVICFKAHQRCGLIMEWICLDMPRQ